ncbi:MAG: threonylcarbamoyl-AMP synthase [Lachnospiraceae bacterium]|nr:threonylcarbamoyl-AMP synthase [Lachnospiraceae bacterium]
METEIIKVNPTGFDAKELEGAGEILRNGGLVAFPTETVYGLGGDAKNKQASKAIYAAKGRPSDNPLIVHIAEFSQLEEIVREVPDSARKLADAFWPGPMTLILPKNDVIPMETTGGLDTVAIRLPSHPVARELILESGCLIAAPSANTSGRPSPTKARHVAEDLSGKIDCIIDGGDVEIGLESTIIDLTEDIPVILRPGYISLEDVEKVVGAAKMDPGILSEDAKVRPKAPGMRYRHYAPKGNLVVVEGSKEAVIKQINSLGEKGVSAGKKVAIMASSETASCYKYGEVFAIGSFEDEDEIARNLYGMLRDFDTKGMELIYSEAFETPHMGRAIMNRLLKAAGHQVITVS